MLTDICNYLNNWFSDEKYIGFIRVTEGSFYCNDTKIEIADGQYFRVIGSLISDGVYKYGTDTITDEGFNGAVWLMRVPKGVIDLAAEITAWTEKYCGVYSMAMSPYNSESFGGYSYSKSAGGASDGSDTPGSWQSVFKARLARYRRI